MKATGIVVGGSMAKQIDCGTTSGIANGSHVSFNFTFINVPTVCVNLMGNWGATSISYINTYSINNTGFYVSSAHLENGTSTDIAMAAQTITWIAIG